MNYRIVSLENEFVEKLGDLICVPNSKEQNSVVSEYLKENMTINYLLHLRYCLLNYISEKKYEESAKCLSLINKNNI